MTVDEAKTKWCPFASVGESFNRLIKIPTDTSCPCLADQCMAWRKKSGASNEGFCGLAGPE